MARHEIGDADKNVNCHDYISRQQDISQNRLEIIPQSLALNHVS